MSEISATVSNFVDSAEKIYTLAMRIKDDLTKYSEKKEEKKIKLQIQKLRDLVGTIDSIITTVYVRLEIMENSDKASMFQKHKNEFKMVFNNIQKLSSQIYELMGLPYFHQYPYLRERLYLKSYIEGFPPPNSYWGDADPRLDDEFVMEQRAREAYQAERDHESETKVAVGAPKLLIEELPEEQGPLKDYWSFEHYLRLAHYITRETLEALNSHIKKEFMY